MTRSTAKTTSSGLASNGLASNGPTTNGRPSRAPIRFRITLAGWLMIGLALAIGGASFVHNVNLLRLLFTLILSAVFVGSWMGRHHLLGLSLRRTFPPAVPVGSRIRCTLEVESVRRRAAMGISISDRVRPRVDAAMRHVRIPIVPPASVARGRYEFTVAHRGEYQFGPALIATGYPFGFVEWSQEAAGSAASEPLVVHPAIGRLKLEARRRLGIASAGAGRGTTGLIEGIDECRGVRDYRDGDPPRLIHWRSTARRGSFVVRELEPAAAGNVLFIVAPRVAGNRQADRDLVETVLSFAATTVAELCRGATVELTLVVASRQPIVVRGTTGPHRTATFMRALAIAQPSTSEESLLAVGPTLLPSDTRGRQLWIVSSTAIPAGLADLLAACGLRRVSSRWMLNASAGDLENLWSPPGRDTPGKPPEPAIDITGIENTAHIRQESANDARTA